MLKTLRSAFIWLAAAIACITVLCFTADAASAVDPSLIGVQKIGPGSSTISAMPAALDAPAEAGINYETETVSGETVYIFEGHRYTLGSPWGVHKLSGYSPTETGTDMTSSGFSATPAHTVAASSELPLGTVIIIKGVGGPYSSDYDGMYVVEDRGGYYIEYEQWIDIFFDSYAEALRTTDAGWNYGEVFIAVPAD